LLILLLDHLSLQISPYGKWVTLVKDAAKECHEPHIIKMYQEGCRLKTRMSPFASKSMNQMANLAAATANLLLLSLLPLCSCPCFHHVSCGLKANYSPYGKVAPAPQWF
jgi:hypothetical protein